LDAAAMLLYKVGEDNKNLICQYEWINPRLGSETWLGDSVELDESFISTLDYCLPQEELCLRSGALFFKSSLSPHTQHLINPVTAPVFVRSKIYGVLVSSKGDEGEEWNENEKNLVIHVSNIFSNVFERDAMERQFSIVERSPDLDLYITQNVGVEYVNPAVTSVTGYTKSEFITKGLSTVFDAKTLADIAEKYIPAAIQEDAVHFETNITRKNGEKRTLAVSIFQAGKNNFGVITNDLTEVRGLEAGLTAEKGRAEHLSRAKSEFLSRMNHEMLTPMNAIIGMVQLVRMEDSFDEAKEFIDKIDASSQELLRLINDVLDIPAMEYDIFKLDDLPFSFRKMLSPVMKNVAGNARMKHHVIKLDIDRSIMYGTFIGDKKRLSQVIFNLLSNAVKFTPENGEICLGARVLSEDDKTITFQFDVTDNGIGIARHQQKKLFDIFEQGDGSLTREHGGIGIGLPLSKLIIEMMGGNIWVESELGKGAKFCFTSKLQKA